MPLDFSVLALFFLSFLGVVATPSPVPVKLVLIGATGAGKTTLLNAIQNREIGYPDSTIGASFVPVRSPQGHIQHWFDTAGQERFAPLLPMYFTDAAVVVLVMDLSLPDPYSSVQRHINVILDNQRRLHPEFVFFVVGNKVDKIHFDGAAVVDKISDHLAKIFSSDRVVTFLLSAKTRHGVPEFSKTLDETIQDRFIVRKDENDGRRGFSLEASGQAKYRLPRLFTCC